jgi:hypothetical protein
MQNASVVQMTLSASIRVLAVAAINSDDKAEKTKSAFFGGLYKAGITPSTLSDQYRDDIKAIVLTTFPKRVQEGVTSKVIRKDDLIKGAKAERTGKLISKVAWQGLIAKKITRLIAGYAAYLARHENKIEVSGKLQNAAVAVMGRATRTPKVEISLEVKTVKELFPLQAAWSNHKAPTTVAVEIAKLMTKILDLAKSADPQALALFNKASVPTKK